MDLSSQLYKARFRRISPCSMREKSIGSGIERHLPQGGGNPRGSVTVAQERLRTTKPKVSAFHAVHKAYLLCSNLCGEASWAVGVLVDARAYWSTHCRPNKVAMRQPERRSVLPLPGTASECSDLHYAYHGVRQRKAAMAQARR